MATSRKVFWFLVASFLLVLAAAVEDEILNAKKPAFEVLDSVHLTSMTRV